MSINILTFRNTNGRDTDVSALRPRANISHVVDEYCSNDDLSQHPNLYTKELMVQAKLQVLFNTVFKEHKKSNLNVRVTCMSVTLYAGV